MKKRLQVLALCIISLYGLLSCGLEEFYYIEYIPDVIQSSNISVLVPLPTAYKPPGSTTYRPGYGSTEYFSNFIIFYRIYLSNFSAVSTLPENFSSVNSTMNSNYTGLYRYTDKTSTTVTSENLETIFYDSFNFFKLALEERSIDDVLSRNSLGRTLRFNFSDVTGTIPSLDILSSNNTLIESFNLLRANKDKLGMDIKTMPDDSRYFMNYEEIRDTAYATRESNADVAIRTGEQDTTLSYILFYIAAQGLTSEMPPRQIFSQPTYIGMFRLPNPN